MSTRRKIFGEVRKLIDLGKITDAKITLQPLITRNYDDTTLHTLLAIIYHLEGNFDRATTSYKKALELDENNVEAMLNFSILCFDLAKYDEGKELFIKAKTLTEQKDTVDTTKDLELDELFAKQHLQLARLYMRYGRFNEALEEVEKGAKLSNNNEEAQLLRAECIFEKGEPERAVLLLSRLKTKSPDYVEARIKLGTYFYRLKDTVSAISEWEKVLEIDPENIEARHFLNIYRIDNRSEV